MKGFEPPAPCSQSTCATKLRYTPRLCRPCAGDEDIIHHFGTFVNTFFKKIFDTFAAPFSPHNGTLSPCADCGNAASMIRSARNEFRYSHDRKIRRTTPDSKNFAENKCAQVCADRSAGRISIPPFINADQGTQAELAASCGDFYLFASASPIPQCPIP